MNNTFNTSNTPNSPYAPKIKQQVIMPALKKSKKVSMITAILAALATLLWFMPVIKYRSDSYTLLGSFSKLSSSHMKDALLGFWLVVALCAVSVIWAIIPKLWSAIVGTVYSVLPLIFYIAQVSDWNSSGLKLTFAANLMIPVAILVLVLSIARIVCFVGDRKKAVKQAPVQPSAPFANI